MIKELVQGSILRTITFCLRLVIAFIITPVLIHSLGNRMYGLWTLVATFMGYYGMLDFGLPSAVGRYVSRAIGRKDSGEFHQVVNTSLALFSCIGAIALVLSWTMAVLSPLFISNPSEIGLFREIIVLLGLSTAMGFPMKVFEGVLTSNLRYDLISYATVTKLLVSNVFIYALLKSGSGILAIAWVVFCASFLEYVLLLFFAWRFGPGFRFSPSLIDRGIVRTLFSYSSKTFIIQLSDILRFRIDSLVIAAYINLGVVTYYSIGASLIEYFVSFIISAIGIMAPVFSQYESVGDYENIRKKFLGMTKISIVLSVFGGLSIMFYGKWFIQRWLGSGFESSYFVALILCIPYIIALMQNPSVGLLYGISKHHYYAITNTIEGVLNLTLSILLVRYYGIYGVALGTALAMITVKLFVQPFIVCNQIKLGLLKYYTETLLFTTVKCAIPLGIYYYIIRNYLGADYVRIAVIGLFQVLFFIPLVYFIVLNRNERQAILGIIKLS